MISTIDRFLGSHVSCMRRGRILPAFCILILAFASTASVDGSSAQMVVGTRVTTAASIDPLANYILVNQATGAVLNPNGDSMARESDFHPAVNAIPFNQRTSQLWRFQHRRNNDYWVRNSYGGRYLGVLDHSLTNGSPIFLTTLRPTYEWRLESVAGGLFRIVNTASSRALAHNGSQVVQESYTGASRQNWAIHLAAASEPESPPFHMMGWATQGGGTTGGTGGPTVTVSTPDAFLNEVFKSGPRVVQFSGVLDFTNVDLSKWSGRNLWGDRYAINDRRLIMPNGNLSIIGIGSNAEIRGLEIRLGPTGGKIDDPKQGNFIIRNIKFTISGALSPHAIANLSDSAIIIHSAGGYVWIDHCDFTDHPNHPDPDGGVDIHGGADFITVSWNKVYDKNKWSLHSSDNVGPFDDPRKNRVTYHHNWFVDYTLSARLPFVLMSGGVHIFNNYYGEAAIRSVIFSHKYEKHAYLEANYAEAKVSPPILNPFVDLAQAHIKDVNSIYRDNQHQRTTDAFVSTRTEAGLKFNPRNHYQYTANHVLNVPRLVKAHAGRGKIDPLKDGNPALPPPSEPPPPPPADPVTSQGQIAYYPLSEGSGGVAADKSSFGTPLDLVLSGGAAWVPGGGVSFNGGSAKLQTSGAATKLFDQISATGQLAVEFWAQPATADQAGPARIVSYSEGSSNRNFTVGHGGSQSDPASRDLTLRIRKTEDGDKNGLPQSAAPNAIAGTMSHYVVTYDGSAVRMYRDGSLVHSEQRKGALTNWDPTYPLVLGNETSSTRGWHGVLRSVAIYDRALSATEIQANYLEQKQPDAPAPEPEAHWVWDPIFQRWISRN
jgi:pectate lyase